MPVAFACVREDPRLDVAMAAPGDRVMMVASGGETALCLARLPLARLVAVDVNPAQLALVRCKEWLARHSSREEALEWLGYLPAARQGRIAQVLEALGLGEDALGPLGLVAELGPDYAGRYELLFAALRRELAAGLPEAFERVMSQENLVQLFGEGATQNPRQPFARHFLERTLVAMEGPPGNPFLSQVLEGRFPPGTFWDWLLDWRVPEVPLEYVCAPMLEALEGAESLDLVHLSNILDWLSPEEATRTLRAAFRALSPGGKVSVRQLNSSLDIPALPSGFSWSRVTSPDRSYFYRALHLGIRP